MVNQVADILILGGGPAGLTAAIYGSRAGHSVTVIEKSLFGGEITSTEMLENYPGFVEGISGLEFGDILEKQAERFGVDFCFADIERVNLEGDVKQIITSSGEFSGKEVIIASGTVPRELGAAGEKDFCGKGVSYCATCDALFYQDKEVAVIGGGDAAVEESLFLSRFVAKLYLIYRGNKLRAVKTLQEQIMTNPKVEILWESTINKIYGDSDVAGIDVDKAGKQISLPVDGVFIFAGRIPNTAFLEGAVKVDSGGFILTDEDMKTSSPGVFAAGDIRSKTLRQVVTAAADGAIAAHVASKELQFGEA